MVAKDNNDGQVGSCKGLYGNTVAGRIRPGHIFLEGTFPPTPKYYPSVDSISCSVGQNFL